MNAPNIAISQELDTTLLKNLKYSLNDAERCFIKAKAGTWTKAAVERLIRLPTGEARRLWLDTHTDELERVRAVNPDYAAGFEAPPEALDAVTDWLLRDGTMPTADGEAPEPALPLGRTLAEALRTGERRRCGTLTIGEPGWAEKIRRDLDTLATSLSKVRYKSVGKSAFLRSSAERLSLLRELRRTFATLSNAQREAEQYFLNRVLPAQDGTDAEPPLLSRALDELVTLFTPARWGYTTLGLGRRQGSNGQQNLSLSHAGEDGAHLRLNTAELNLFTVALFLLCAPGTGNPVRLLVLDDPLQNMDEQTVTVLARGIGKLVRLLPGGWQLVFFFHGEDDLARFRNELPARIYSLPWLMPVGSGGSGDLDIKGANPPAPCATTPVRQHPRDVLRRPR